MDNKRDQNPRKKVKEGPWGRYEQFLYDELGTLKLVYIKSGERISTQRHRTRDEFWKVMWGSFEIIKGNETFEASEDEEIFISKGTIHGAKNIGDEEGLILAISYGHFDPDDKERIDDKYGRHRRDCGGGN